VPHDSTDGDLLITDDRSLLDVDVIHDVLKQTYWSGNIPRDLLVRAIDNSIPVGLYRAGERWDRSRGYRTARHLPIWRTCSYENRIEDADGATN
jgi:hypothetical protein